MSENQSIPNIESKILKRLDGDVRETAMEFVAYLKENNMTPLNWFGLTWRIPYGNDFLFGIFLNQEGKFRIYFFLGDYQGSFDEGFIKTVHDNVGPCVHCTGDDCPHGKEMTIFGRKFSNTCYQFPVRFENPDDAALGYIKELIEYWKKIAPHSESWHAH